MFDRSAFLGHYLPLSSPLHRLDPRTKLVLVISWGVLIFWLKAPAAYGWLLLAVLSAFALARVPTRQVLAGIRPMLFLLLVTLGLNLFFAPGKPLATIGPLTITDEGVRQSLVMGGRMLVLLLLAFLLMCTTSPIALTAGLEFLLAPLRLLRVPVQDLALMTTIALRFIPTLFDEFYRIVEAQQSRGARFDDRNLYRRFALLLPICIPLFVGAFRRASELGVAMEARGFLPGVKRSRYRALRFGLRDLVALLLSTALFLVIR